LLNIRKFVSILLVTLVFSSITCFTAFAAAKVTFTASNVKGSIVDTVSVSVSIEPNSQIASCSLTLSYDSSKLQCISAQKGSIPVDIALAPVISTPGTITYEFARMSNLTAGGSVFTAKFKIIASSQDKVPLSLTIGVCTDQNAKAIETAVSNGSIEITGSAVSAASSVNSVHSSASNVATSSELPSVSYYSDPTVISKTSVAGATEAVSGGSSKANSSMASASVALPISESSVADPEKHITISGSNLPSDLTVSVIEIDQTSQLYETYSKQLDDKLILGIYDITLIQGQSLYALSEPIQVTLPLPAEGSSNGQYRIALFKSDHSVEYLSPEIIDSDMVFTVDELGTIAVLGEETSPILMILSIFFFIIALTVYILRKNAKKDTVNKSKS